MDGRTVGLVSVVLALSMMFPTSVAGAGSSSNDSERSSDSIVLSPLCESTIRDDVNTWIEDPPSSEGAITALERWDAICGEEFTSPFGPNASGPVDEELEALYDLVPFQAVCSGSLPGQTAWTLTVDNTKIPLLTEPGEINARFTPQSGVWAGAYSDMAYSLSSGHGRLLAIPTSGFGGISVDCGKIDVPNAPDPDNVILCSVSWGHTDNILGGTGLVTLSSSGSAHNPLNC